jgi:lipopolysaccharide transport system ATP-binding protein
LIVTHALDQIARFCDEAVWLERGRIMARGPALEVIKRYELYIRRLEDRRLKAKNLKAQSGRYSAMEQELYADGLALQVGVREGTCDVSQVALLRDGGPEDAVRVGDAQDADPTQSAYVVTDGDWSPPEEEGDQCFRTLSGPRAAIGRAYFHLWALYHDSTYAMDVTYRTSAGCIGTLEAVSGAEVVASVALQRSTHWRTERVVVEAEHTARARPRAPVTHRADDPAKVPAAPDATDGAAIASTATRSENGTVSRWPGVGSLLIERVLLLDSQDDEQAIFQAASPMKLELSFRAEKSGVFPLTLAAILYRIDGVRVSTHIGDAAELVLDQGERRGAVLDFGPLNLGDGRYVATVALYESLSAHGASPFYDLIDRSYEFEVVGNPPFAGVFQHPGVWQMR